MSTDADTPDSMTIIAFSGDLDKLWPTMILSSTGAATALQKMAKSDINLFI